MVYPLLIRVLCFCGLRISEALNLKVKNIDFDNGSFLLQNNKTYQERIITLDDNLKERFCAYKRQMNFKTGEDYFFPAPDGYRYSVATMDTTFRKALYEAGIPYQGKGKGPRLHDLRHTFCVHSLQKLTSSGQNPYTSLPVLMTYLGHKSTSRYVHLSAESYPALLKQSETIFGNLIPWEDYTDD